MKSVFIYNSYTQTKANIYYPVINASFLKLNLANDQLKKKQSPLQAWTGPEGSRRLRLPDFKTIGT